MKIIPIWKIIILVLETIIEVSLMLAMLNVTSGYIQDSNSEMIPYGVVFSTCGLFWLAITSFGFLRYIASQKYILLTGLGMKLLVGCLGLALLCLPGMYPVYSLLVFAVISIILLALHKKAKEIRQDNLAKLAREKRRQEWKETHFQSYKSNWVWDDAAVEYSKWKNKELAEFTDEDEEKIYEYATNPMAYFFSWIVKHDFCSDLFFEKNESGMVDFEHIKSETINPCDFVSAYMDYGWFREDIDERILEFVDDYFEGHRYEDDYNSILRQEGKLYYCHDFSWDTYHKLENLMDEQYKFFLCDMEEMQEDLYSESTLPDVPWHRIGQMLELHVAEGVSQKYVDTCVDHLNHLPDELLQEICDWIFMIFEINVNYEAVEENHLLLLEQLYEGSMHIYKPHGEEPAFVLGFKAEFQSDYGISVVIRGHEYTEICYRGESSSPWTRDNAFVYYTKVQRKESHMQEVQIKAHESGFQEEM